MAVEPNIHNQISQDWAVWKRALNGRHPSAKEVMEYAIELDKRYGNHLIPIDEFN